MSRCGAPFDASRSARARTDGRTATIEEGNAARLGSPEEVGVTAVFARPLASAALDTTDVYARAQGAAVRWSTAMATLGPESARAPHSQLGSSPSTQSHIGGANPPPNRGLERALEEAAASGALNLSTRKLKEFPRTAANHDLSDTVEADLSKNRLADVPSEICHLVALETLNLYHNCIRTIPDSIITLQSLTSLNLSRNQLGALPACLCGLPLRVLNASNNKLVSLPETIGQLHCLMELDISCNEITALPRHIGRLKALRELNVRRNLLCVLPEDLAGLPLVKFDFSCNKVSTIPVCYRKMKHLQSLQLENNPLQSPPAQICIKGKVHIFKYLSIEACRSEKMPDSLYLPVIERLSLSRPTTGSVEDMEQQKKQDSDSGVGSDNGDKRLSATEPSDEDSLSLNIPMSHITEEEGISKDDSSEHISSLTADPNSDSVRLIEESPTEALKDQFSYRDSALSTRFVNYIKGRTAADFDEPLRIEEDAHWTSQQLSKVKGGTEFQIDMINQLKEAVELLQDPSRVNAEQDDLSGVQLYPVEMVTVEDSLNGQDSDDGIPTPKRHDRFPGCGPPSFSSPVFGLKPRSVFLRSHKSLESVDPQFTMRRKMEQLREELELTEQLRDSIESRLKVVLPEDLGSSLMDGVVLCHLANHIRPRSVGSIHVPSPAVPKLSMAKCRRNVENFLDACRKIGLSEPLGPLLFMVCLLGERGAQNCSPSSVSIPAFCHGNPCLLPPHTTSSHSSLWPLTSELTSCLFFLFFTFLLDAPRPPHTLPLVLFFFNITFCLLPIFLSFLLFSFLNCFPSTSPSTSGSLSPLISSIPPTFPPPGFWFFLVFVFSTSSLHCKYFTFSLAVTFIYRLLSYFLLLTSCMFHLHFLLFPLPFPHLLHLLSLCFHLLFFPLSSFPGFFPSLLPRFLSSPRTFVPFPPSGLFTSSFPSYIYFPPSYECGS
uniref:leucine-rich repeat and calponin homology domain-containing protein 1 isoform X5 n=1 Tax=Gasterosteus aculeatus aculeatus TaxID=481459 RepID=UPI001A99BC0F|nr:leucine-rich repeat and calponin homology domain-containing protein 1 isoform X5 [Gasterosteus aculeatus aculeatus]